MARKPNYDFEKRRKEQERQKKKEEKREERLRRKREGIAADGDDATGDAEGTEPVPGDQPDDEAADAPAADAER